MLSTFTTLALFSLHHLCLTSATNLHDSHVRKERDLKVRLGGRALRPRASVTPTPGERILLWGDDRDADDEVQTVELPFPIEIYDESSTTMFVSTNGVIGIGSAGSGVWSNEPIPYQSSTDLYHAVFPFWDDLYVSAGSSQTIYLKLTDNSFVLEYFVGRYEDRGNLHHFSVSYNSHNPGKFQVKYYGVPTSGGSATIGVQGLTIDDATHYVQYSYETSSVSAGTLLNIDTSSGTGSISAGTFPL